LALCQEDSFVPHRLQLIIRYIVAVIDGVCVPIDRRLNATRAGGMNGNLQVLAVSFFDDCRHFRHGHVVLDGNLDEVDVMEDVVFHCLPRSVGAVHT